MTNLSYILTKTAYNHSLKAYGHQYYLTRKKDAAAPSIIAFKGSADVQELYGDGEFGETSVDGDQFPSLRRIGESLLAKVNASVLEKFKELLNIPGFKSEVEKIIKEEKKILLAGHSVGGALASLVTLWLLDEYRRKRKLDFQIDCVTFGSPLIGDWIVAHAVRRENWAGHFTHFVMERDIVPRMMLAPKTSVQEHLPNIVKFFQNFLKVISKKGSTDHDQGVELDGEDFFENVLINASTVASHDAYDLMEPTNSLKDKLSADFVKVSPYRPFGVYVFCTQGEDASTPRQQLVVENPNAALQLLFYFLQLPNEDQDLAKFALNSLNEHFSYGELTDKRADLSNLNKDLLTSNGTTGDAVRTSNKALFELAASAKWCLLAVEEAEKRKKEKMDEVKKSMRKYRSDKPIPKIIEDLIDDICKYKEKHGTGTTDYYEAFKLQKEDVDFEANLSRLEQAKIWDVIVEMVMRKDLPDEFEVCGELVDLGTRFRRLYEPLDIANYYRHSKGEGYNVGENMSNRPKRYKFTQRWYQHANVTGFDKISESNFVAELEQLMIEFVKPKDMTIEEIKEKYKSIKDQVQKWKTDEKIEKADVFWGESILSKLEQMLASG